MQRRTFLLAAPAILPLSAQAQTTLPDKGLRIVVGFVANGGADLMARTIAPVLQRRMGRRVTVENRSGNTGQGADAEARFGQRRHVDRFHAVDHHRLAGRSGVLPVRSGEGSCRHHRRRRVRDGARRLEWINVTTVRTFALWARDGEPDRCCIGVTASDALLQVYARTIGRTIGRAIDVPLEAVGYRGALPLATDLETGKAADRRRRLDLVPRASPWRAPADAGGFR